MPGVNPVDPGVHALDPATQYRFRSLDPGGSGVD